MLQGITPLLSNNEFQSGFGIIFRWDIMLLGNSFNNFDTVSLGWRANSRDLDSMPAHRNSPLVVRTILPVRDYGPGHGKLRCFIRNKANGSLGNGLPLKCDRAGHDDTWRGVSG